MQNRPNNRPVWIAFLLACFLITGLTGLFASYAPGIPLERALHRLDVLEQVLAASGAPDPAARLEALRPALAENADAVLKGGGDLAARVDEQRRRVIAEGMQESNAVAARTRLMLGIVTVLAAGLGAGILLLASKPAPG